MVFVALEVYNGTAVCGARLLGKGTIFLEHSPAVVADEVAQHWLRHGGKGSPTERERSLRPEMRKHSVSQ